jgi:probable F420-dependent oxidoreductase
VRLGLVLPNTGPAAVDAVRRLPASAERWGYDSVWFTDHVVGVDEYTVYGPEWAEITVCLTWAAATTTRIRLGSGVLVLAYRHPVHAAKTLATIDALSAGRLDVGVGVGWARTEFDALGVGHVFGSRGAWTDDALALLRRCWQGGELSWDGPSAQVPPVIFEPRPVQPGGPPLWIGGQSPAAMRRAARSADVWHPFDLSPAELTERGTRVDELAGRQVPRSIRRRYAGSVPVELIVRDLRAYADDGCVEAVVDLVAATVPELEERAQELAGAAVSAGIGEHLGAS